MPACPCRKAGKCPELAIVRLVQRVSNLADCDVENASRIQELLQRVAALEADHRQLESISGRVFQLEADLKLLRRLATEVVEMEEKRDGPLLDMREAGGPEPAAPKQAAAPQPRTCPHGQYEDRWCAACNGPGQPRICSTCGNGPDGGGPCETCDTGHSHWQPRSREGVE